MNKRWFLFVVLTSVALGLVGAGYRANGTMSAGQGSQERKPPVLLKDSLKLVSLIPASGLVAAKPGMTLGPGNSVEATFDYTLNSRPKAYISVYTTGETGNSPHTGCEVGRFVQRGQGTIKTRFSVECDGKNKPPFVIATIRYVMSDQSTTPATMLVEKYQTVNYRFTCPSIGLNK